MGRAGRKAEGGFALDRITIVGMGPVGTSIGLALKEAKLANTEIIGTSAERNDLNKAAKMGAVDDATPNLRSAVQGAKLVILDVSITDTREFLDVLGTILDDGAVVTDTGATKVRVTEWAEESLPKGISFVGGNPLMKNPVVSLEDANPAAFKGINYCVIPSESAEKEAVRTVVGLVEILGAKPLFLDPHEHDSYAVAMTYLPIVMSSAFVTATSGSRSWREMHRLASSEFSEFSRLAGNDPQDNETACLTNPDALVTWLDSLITELYFYRNQIKDRSEDLLETFIKAWEARSRWEVNAVVEDEQTAMPSARESMASAFLGERLLDRYRQMTGSDKQKHDWKYKRKV